MTLPGLASSEEAGDSVIRSQHLETNWDGAMTPGGRGQKRLKNEIFVQKKILCDFITGGVHDMLPLLDDKF